MTDKVDGGELPEGGRLAGIDSWKAALMLGGFLVHGVLWQEPRPFFQAVVLASNSFRMGVFFAVSGFLCAAALARREPVGWLRRRLVALGVPLLFGMTVLSPVCWWLAQLRGEPFASATLMFDWHHLWFLAGLLPLSVGAAMWDVRGTRSGRLARLTCVVKAHITQAPPSRTRQFLLALALSCATFEAVASLLIRCAAPEAWTGPLANTRLIAAYTPLFALGFACGRSVDLRTMMTRCAGQAAVALACLAAMTVAWTWLAPDHLPAGLVHGGGQVLPILLACLCPPLVFSVVLRTSFFDGIGWGGVRHLSDASYAMYVVHLPLLLAFNTAFSRVQIDPHVEYVLAVIGAGGLSFLLYWYGVRRSAFLALLFTGRYSNVAVAAERGIDAGLRRG